MLKKSKKTQAKPPLRTGQTLPNRVTAYSPAHPRSADVEIEAKPRRSIGKIIGWFLLLIILAALAIVIVLGAWDARNISKASQKMFGSGDIFSLIKGGSLKTDASGRVNVLIAGYSVDDPGHAGAQLTDSILLLSMDPASRTGYMLSIPRDLYVNLGGGRCQNGGDYCKINEAYLDGGMPLLERVVEADFNVQVGYYALVDYSAVRDIVNALGGITVTINSPDGRLYDPNKDWVTGGPLVDLANGPHALNGQQALDLTRARGDPSPYGIPIGFEQSDFQRTADQRLVFSAIKSKLDWKLVLNPRKNSQILNAIADNVKTDLGVSQVRPLFGLFNSIPDSKLKSLSLRDLSGHNYLIGYLAPTGEDALIPAAGIDDYSQIDQAVAQLNQ